MAIHKDNLQWLEFTEHPLTPALACIIEELLVKSPALDVSARSQGFIDRFHVSDSLAAESLFDYLTDGVDVLHPNRSRYATSADEVEALLINKRLLNGPFWNKGEFLLFTVSNETKTQVKNFVHAIASSGTGLSNQKANLVQTKFQMVDSLFRHIRNALAHGSFQVKVVEGVSYLILQDANLQGMISARMVLTTERLESWITAFYRFQKTGI